MTISEFENWRSQFVTSKSDRMGLRYKPMAFTEQGEKLNTLPAGRVVYPF
jgi:allophanate hydrolase subunit 2